LIAEVLHEIEEALLLSPIEDTEFALLELSEEFSVIRGEVEAVIEEVLISLVDFCGSEIKDSDDGCEDEKENDYETVAF
jgi:hypothetical protein